MNTNVLYCGDCLEVMKTLPDNSIDLVYLDPPFFSQRNYENFWVRDKVTKFGFSDREWEKLKGRIDPVILKECEHIEERWKGGRKGIYVYIAYMKERMIQCERVLKNTGTIYLHCDYHAAHYLKVMMDEVFGYGNFISEIIWRRKYQNATITSNTRSYGNNHDIILFYGKSDKYKFNSQLMQLEVDPADYRQDGKGYYKNAPAGNYCKSTIDEMMENGTAYKTSGGKYRKKTHLRKVGKSLIDERPVDNIWMDLPNMMHVSKQERTGYPTQKPESLLERIIRTSSDDKDIVLDPFCGCGTALVVANRLGRRFIGIDISRTGCRVTRHRLGGEAHIIGGERMKDLKVMPPHEFAQLIIQEKLHGIVNPKKSGDLGIDGWIDFKTVPVQVKRWGHKVGRPEIDKFRTAVERNGRTKGIIVAFNFSRDAYGEAKRKTGLDIELKTVKSIMEGIH